VHGAEGGGATRSHHAHGDDHGCNGDAGEQGDEQVVVDGGDVGGSGRGPTRGGTELEAGGQGTWQAGGFTRERLKLKHFASARRQPAVIGAAAARRAVATCSGALDWIISSSAAIATFRDKRGALFWIE
jgi:hypothetical protein